MFSGDRTPPDYEMPVPSWSERLKRPLRRLVYPAYNFIVNRKLAARYAQTGFEPDLWLWGQRGNDYERHRRRVNHYLPLADRNLLIAGCGTGRDVASWLTMRPRRVLGIDWFDYDRAWKMWQREFAHTAPTVEVTFAQGDLENLESIAAASIDVFGSDAVFEHLRNLPQVLGQARRVLRPGGVLYATFGPLWHAWGGDHASGYDGLASGFNHLLLDAEAYRIYLQKMGERRHSEHDGRTWIDHDLFSRLTPREYLDQLSEAGFERLFVAAVVEPRALKCLTQFPEVSTKLLPAFGLLNLITTGMTVIYRRPRSGV